jgi:GR25 family glycosyltransferase involved in LPS biosynthesis
MISCEDFDGNVFVVNLKSRADRWQRFEEHVRQIDWPFGTCERFLGTDGQLARPPAWWRQGAGAWGCLQSHLRILEKAISEGRKYVMVLEDDVSFVPNLAKRAREFLRTCPTTGTRFTSAAST